MISAYWLFLIIPMSYISGFVMCALFKSGEDHNETTKA